MLEVEKIGEKAFALLAAVAIVAGVLAPVMGSVRARAPFLRAFIGCWRCGCLGGGALDELVQLSAVQPDSAALRAVIDLYVLALGDDERGISAGGTLHDSFTFACSGSGSIGNDGVWAGLLCVEISSEGRSTAGAMDSSRRSKRHHHLVPVHAAVARGRRPWRLAAFAFSLSSGALQRPFIPPLAPLQLTRAPCARTVLHCGLPPCGHDCISNQEDHP